MENISLQWKWIIGNVRKIYLRFNTLYFYFIKNVSYILNVLKIIPRVSNSCQNVDFFLVNGRFCLIDK